MPTSLTATKIKDTYGQLLHVDGGVTSTLKTVYDGDGTATALKISTTAVEIPSFTLSGGTANGVAYLNGSKVLTTGSALTFDGTRLTLNGNALVTNTNPINFYSTEYFIRANVGLELQSKDVITQYINSSEQMRLTSTGLGIGTSSPSYKLDVTGSGGRFTSTQGVQTTIEFAPGLAYFGTLTNHPLVFETNGAERMRLDSSGNLGLGVTPSAWSGIAGIQSAYGALSGNNAINIVQNAYYNAGWKYTGTAAASQYQQAAGAHYWYTAPSGTAGNAISFTQAMTLDASGNQLLGKTTSSFSNAGRVSFEINGSTDSLISMQYAGANSAYLQLNSSEWRFWNTGNTPILFATNGSERARIDSSGNVGIGTSSPSYKLDIFGTTPGLRIKANGVGNGVKLEQSSATGEVQLNVIDGYALTFATSNTERMRIDSSGNLLVGGTSVNESFALPTIQGSTNCLFTNKRNTTGSASQFRFYNPNGMVGEISTSGSSTSYGTSSDYRLKENIQPMQNALGVVAQLNPVTYTWKADGSDGQGFIAHELQAVVPDCVTGEKDAVDAEGNPVYQGIDTSFLVATLTKAIQELNEKVTQQAAEIAALKGA